MSETEEKIWKKIWKEGNNQGFDMNETDAHNVFVAIKPLIQSYAYEQNKKEAEENVKVEYELGLKVSRLEAKLKEAEEQNKKLVDNYELADSIRKSYCKHGRDSWVSIANDVIEFLNQQENE